MPFQLLDAPFYGGSPSGTEFYTGTTASSSLVPDVFNCAINGVGFMVDFDQPFYRQYRRQLAQLIRTQADTSTLPGDQSMDPNSLWRRSFEDWSLGSGQRYLDRPTVNGSPATLGSVPNAFWASKGIDALTTKWQISLLPDTVQLRASTMTNLNVVVALNYIYVTDGTGVYYSSSLGGAFTAVTGTPGLTVSSICTDGFNIWFACGTDGIYHTTAGSAIAADQWVTSPVDTAAMVGYANGRLMVASTNIIYNIIAGTGSALPLPLYTDGNPLTRFTNFASGLGAVYVGGGVGSQSWIYGMTVTSDGVALGAPIIQGALPPGETIASLYGSPLGFLIVGSSLGIRMCTESSTGAVTVGSLITTPQPVQCIAGWNRWVYFGWTTYDNVSSGLGRLDLQNQVIDNVLPAVCSDLMVTSQNAVVGLAIYNGQPVFSLAGVGFYGPDVTHAVKSGTFQSGYIMYDLTDSKVAALLDVQTVGPRNYGSYTASVSTDNGPFDPVGGTTAATTSSTQTYTVGPQTGERFEVQLQLFRDATVTANGPTISRFTLRAWPAPKRSTTWQLPLILNENTENKSFQNQGYSPLDLLQQLETYANLGQLVNFQEGHQSYPVFVQDVQFLPQYPMINRTNEYFNGLALVTLVGLPITTG